MQDSYRTPSLFSFVLVLSLASAPAWAGQLPDDIGKFKTDFFSTCEIGDSGTSTYAFCRALVPINLDTARGVCNNMNYTDGLFSGTLNTDMVVIDSPEENAYVANTANAMGMSIVWLSAVRSDLIEGSPFYWEPVGGQGLDTLSYSNWASGEPNDFLGLEDCSVMFTDSGEWNDVSCLELHDYVCEINCDDGNTCTVDKFDFSTLACKNTGINCDDGNPCTLDTCVEGGGCTYQPNPCDDGDPCTSDSCDPASGCQSTMAHFDALGSTYLACEGPLDWSSAQSACQARGMNLATISDGADNAIVTNFAQGQGLDGPWIGYNDQSNEGVFEWVSGASGFEAWCPNEPNDVGGEDCVHLAGCEGDGWNDFPCGNQRPFVCEQACDDGNSCTLDVFDLATGQCTYTPDDGLCDDGDPCTTDRCDADSGCSFPVQKATFGGHGYLYCEELFDYGDATNACAARGMTLVSVNSAAENLFLVDLALESDANSTWIGYTDELVEGSFGWVGMPSTYEQWCDGEPNNTDGNEDCTQLGFCDNGGWNDASCSTPLPFVCEFDCSDPALGGECDFTVTSVSPAASETDTIRDLEIIGSAFTAQTTATLEGFEVLGLAVQGPTLLSTAVSVPQDAGTYDLTVMDNASGETVILPDAFTAVSSGFCGGLTCDACVVDADCVEGDRCTQDYCTGGFCVHVPRQECCGPEGCDVCTVGGDLNASGEVSISDVQCGILLTLWDLGGKTTPVPTCYETPVAAADLDCDGASTVTDILLLIGITLTGEIDPGFDDNGDGCHDACPVP